MGFVHVGRENNYHRLSTALFFQLASVVKQTLGPIINGIIVITPLIFFFAWSVTSSNDNVISNFFHGITTGVPP